VVTRHWALTLLKSNYYFGFFCLILEKFALSLLNAFRWLKRQTFSFFSRVFQMGFAFAFGKGILPLWL